MVFYFQFNLNFFNIILNAKDVTFTDKIMMVEMNSLLEVLSLFLKIDLHK